MYTADAAASITKADYANQSRNSNLLVQPPQIAILQEINGQLQEIIERSAQLSLRQRAALNRVFGPRPEADKGKTIGRDGGGFVESIKEKLGCIHAILGDIVSNTEDFERIA